MSLTTRIYNDGQIAGTLKKDLILLPEWMQQNYSRHHISNGLVRFIPTISDMDHLHEILNTLLGEANEIKQNKIKILKIAICVNIFDLNDLYDQQQNILEMLLPMVHVCRKFLWSTENHNKRIEVFPCINPIVNLPYEDQRQIIELVCERSMFEVQQYIGHAHINEQVHQLSVKTKVNLFKDINTMNYTAIIDFIRAFYNAAHYPQYYTTEAINEICSKKDVKEFMMKSIQLKPDGLVDVITVIAHGKIEFLNMSPLNIFWNKNNVTRDKWLSGTTQMYDDRATQMIQNTKEDNRDVLQEHYSNIRPQANVYTNYSGYTEKDYDRNFPKMNRATKTRNTKSQKNRYMKSGTETNKFAYDNKNLTSSSKNRSEISEPQIQNGQIKSFKKNEDSGLSKRNSPVKQNDKGKR